MYATFLKNVRLSFFKWIDKRLTSDFDDTSVYDMLKESFG